MNEKFDLIIIGGGALGAFHAYHALQSGKKVALFERNTHPRGATVQNFGQIVPSGMDDTWQMYGRKSLEIYKSIQGKFDISVVQNGSIYIASNAGELQLIEELYAVNQAQDYPSQLWSAHQCLQHYPSLQKDYCKGALFFPEEISVNPRRMVGQLHAFMQQNPAFNYLPNHQIKEVAAQNDGSVNVMTAGGKKYNAEKVIICSGSEFKTLFPEVFNQSDLEAVKIQMLRLKPQKQIKIPGNILTGLSIRRYESFRACPSYQSVTAQDDPNSFWKKWGVHILFKQETDGSIILGDSHEYADAKEIDLLDFDTKLDITNYFISEGKKIFALAHWDIDMTWFGIYSQCKTQDIFNHTVGDNIHIVTGIGGKGMTASAGYSFYHLKNLYHD